MSEAAMVEVNLAKRRKNRRGMSLVEVMVVIAIVLTLMAILGGIALSVFANAKVSTTELQMHEVKQAVDLYAIKKGAPSTSEGLKAVYDGLSMDVPKDAWDHDFIYVNPGPDGKQYDVVSYGSDGTEGGTGNAADIKLSELH
jgi:general secretion pathway protein G